MKVLLQNCKVTFKNLGDNSGLRSECVKKIQPLLWFYGFGRCSHT